MDDKIYVVMGLEEAKANNALAALKAQYGERLEVVTPEEAKKRGIVIEDNLKKFTPVFPTYVNNSYQASGQELRRSRRKHTRNAERLKKKYGF